MSLTLTGKMSIFGGPDDDGMKQEEGLSLYTHKECDERLDLFYQRSENLSIGESKRLRPQSHYFAYRFDLTPPVDSKKLQNTPWLLRNPLNDKVILAWAVDWGPNVDTGRVFDVSPGVADFLNIQTDSVIVGSEVLQS